MSRTGATTRLAALVAAVGLGVTGCSGAVHVPAGTDAGDPACAEIVLALPSELAGLAKHSTDAQATAAWGEGDPVTFRCGVQPPPPTTDRCVTVTAPDGTSVDWLSVPAEDGSGDWTLTTYGRRPAIEVHVPGSVAGEQPTDLLLALGPAVQRAAVERTCL